MKTWFLGKGVCEGYCSSAIGDAGTGGCSANGTAIGAPCPGPPKLNSTFGGFADTKWNDCRNPSRSCGLNCCDNGGTPANFIFGLGPGEPTRYGVTNFNGNYQSTSNGNGLWVWPAWGGSFGQYDLNMGQFGSSLGSTGMCGMGHTYGHSCRYARVAHPLRFFVNSMILM